MWIDFSDELVVAPSDRWLRYERTSTQAWNRALWQRVYGAEVDCKLYFLWRKISAKNSCNRRE
jgi:hypothetical protein